MKKEQKVLTYHPDKQFIRGQRIQCMVSDKGCLPCIVNSLAISIPEKKISCSFMIKTKFKIKSIDLKSIVALRNLKPQC